MAWHGWFQFAGTEVVNVERTAQYVRKNLPGLGFQNKYDSTGLPLGLEYLDAVDTIPTEPVYESPALDQPDWFDPANPDTLGFYGLYPLSVEGIEDSPSTATVTELIGDGGVVSGKRARSKQIRLTGLLLGASDAAVDAGLAWLAQALEGAGCAEGDCGGETLCFLASAPNVSPVASLCGEGYTMAEDGSCVPLSFYEEYAPDDIYRYYRSVLLGTIPEADWNALIVLGWYGDPTDGEERLYPPADWPTQAPVGAPGGVQWQHECMTGLVRQLHDVTVLEGPRVVETYAPTSGAVKRVELVLVAGNPHVWGLPVTVPFSPNPPMYTVAGTPAAPVYLAADRTNLATNPSMEVSAAGWVGSNADEISRINLPGPVGSSFGRAIFREPMDENYFLNDYVAIAVGQVYTASLYVRSTTIKQVRTRLWWYNGTTLVSTTTSDLLELRTGWNRLPITGTAPAGTTDVRASIYMEAGLLPMNRINLANNPSSEVRAWSAANWGTGGNGALARVTTGGLFGPAFTRMTWTVAASAGGGIGGTGTENVNISVTADTRFSASVSARTNRLTYLRMEAGGAQGPPVMMLPNVWTRLSVTGVTQGAPATISPMIRPAAQAGANPWRIGDTLDVDGLLVETGPSIDPFGEFFTGSDLGGQWSGAAGESTSLLSPVLDFDGLLLERSAVMDTYFDGDTVDTEKYRYSWTGGVGVSTSTRQPTAHFEVDCTTPPPAPFYDPLLPVPPSPPRPPAVTNAALVAVTQWHRYVQDIPAALVPVWSNAVPIVTIDNTEGTDLRMVRIRFYSNPFGHDIRDVEPCAYCGDFIIAYIPAGAVFTLDGQAMEADVLLPGAGATTRATHVLYGTGGKPFEWPLLSCGTQYAMTFDFAHDVNTGHSHDVSFTLEVVGRN